MVNNILNLNINKKNVQKVLLKKCLKHYKWYNEKAYKLIDNRFRWFMKTHHYYEYKNKEYIITNVSYNELYKYKLYINYIINEKEYIYIIDLYYLLKL